MQNTRLFCSNINDSSSSSDGSYNSGSDSGIVVVVVSILVIVITAAVVIVYLHLLTKFGSFPKMLHILNILLFYPWKRLKHISSFNQFQRQLTTPSRKKTLLNDRYMEEKYFTS